MIVLLAPLWLRASSPDSSIPLAEAEQQQLLWKSARKGDVESLASLLSEESVVLNALDPVSGFAALHLAAGHGEHEAVKLLLEHGARVNVETREGITPMQCAAGPGHGDIVRHLVSAPGVALDVQERVHGFTALMMSAHMGHLDCVRALLDAGANARLTLLIGPEDAYSLSMSAGHTEIAHVLREHEGGGLRGPVSIAVSRWYAARRPTCACTHAWYVHGVCIETRRGSCIAACMRARGGWYLRARACACLCIWVSVRVRVRVRVRVAGSA